MLTLLVSANPETADALRGMLGEIPGDPIAVEWTPRIEIALSRLARARVDLILLDHISPVAPGVLGRLRGSAPAIPVVVLGAEENDQALRQGAQDHVVLSQTTAPALARAMRYAVARHARQNGNGSRAREANVLSVWGGKGGVGATTVALNVAAALAAGGARVVAIEFRGFYGSFRHHLGNHHPLGDMGGLLGMDAMGIDEGALLSRLYTLPGGLSFLFAPREATDFQDISSDQAEHLIDAAQGLADHVVLDLPSAPLAGNRAALRRSHAVLMVSDRDPDSLSAASTNLELLRSWKEGAGAAQTVVVQRNPLALPISLQQIASRLDQPVAAMIPPAADACLQAHRAGLPLVLAQPESAPARAFLDLVSAITGMNRAAGGFACGFGSAGLPAARAAAGTHPDQVGDFCQQ